MTFVKSHADEIQGVLESFQLKSVYIPHRTVYFITGKEPEYVLKPLKVGAVQAYLIGSLLAKQGLCPIMPQIIKPESGGYYLWNRGNRYLLLEKLKGREADYYLLSDVKAVIIAMSIFHRFGRERLATEPKRWMLLKFYPEREWRKRILEMEICREIAIRAQDDPWSRRYLQVWHKFFDLACEAVRDFNSFSIADDDTICYHDWAFHNLIIHQNNAYLIDFDYMLVDHSIHDRANLISRYLRLNQWSIRALLKILWNFDRAYPWKKGDLSMLRIYLLFPYEFWMLGRQYYLEKQHWSKQFFQEQWERKISYFEERLKVLDLIANME